MASNKITSLGIQCASYGCYSREYKIEIGQRIRTGISMFLIPKDARKLWCNLIKHQEGKDGFKITHSTRICEKHFEPSDIYRPPGGTKKRLCLGKLDCSGIKFDL